MLKNLYSFLTGSIIGVLGGFAGSYLLGMVSSSFLKIFLGTILLISAFKLFYKKRKYEEIRYQ